MKTVSCDKPTGESMSHNIPSTALRELLLIEADRVIPSHDRHHSGLPPPPKYPAHLLQTGPDGKLQTQAETVNTLKRPAGPEYQLVVGEGAFCAANGRL
jgi:hypothetical protein